MAETGLTTTDQFFGLTTDQDREIINLLRARGYNKLTSELIHDFLKKAKSKKKLTKKDLPGMSAYYLHTEVDLTAIYDIINESLNAPSIDGQEFLKKIEIWLSSRYEFRRNEITARVYYRPKGTAKFEKCNYNDIWRELQHNLSVFGKKSKVPMSDLQNLLDSAFVPDYNPFLDYFNSLPAWDGQDHILKMADHLTSDDQIFWRKQFKKAIVRQIACTIGGIENRIVMTLVQESQSRGKSSYLRFLCPPELSEYYKEDPLVHNKDSEIALAENFMWNIEELANLNRKEVSELKAIISRSKIKQRRSYGRHEETMRRIVNFWGSTNKLDFLSDIENTRWLCFNVLDISYEYNNWKTGKKGVDITQFWAQAWHLYKEKFDYNLDDVDADKQRLSNRGFENITPEKELIIQSFSSSAEGALGAEFMINIDIVQYLSQKAKNQIKISPENAGRAMKQLGFEQKIRKIDGKTVRGYWIVKRLVDGTTNIIDIEHTPKIQTEIFGEQVIEVEEINPDDLPF